VTEFARSYRRAFARHPHVIAAIGRRPINTPASLIAAIGRRPINTPASLNVYDGFLRFLGHHGFDRPPSGYGDEYPQLVRVLAAGDLEEADHQGFELALAALVDRVALLLESDLPTTPPYIDNRRRSSDPESAGHVRRRRLSPGRPL
jgi:hypothetical protein